jgi:hypothetical protein
MQVDHFVGWQLVFGLENVPSGRVSGLGQQ